MVITVNRHRPNGLHPIHALLSGFAVPLYLGALLSDVAYAQSSEVQWTNFAAWLIAGGLVFGGIALLWALVALLGVGRSGRRPLPYFLMLLAAWILGFADALVHAKDAWASMPAGLVLSLIVTALAIVATVMAFIGRRTGYSL